jgi:serine/threonine protein kinase
MSPLAERDELPGKSLRGIFTLAGKIGAGAVSEVYLGRQKSLGNRNVAVKVLKKVICASGSEAAAVHVNRFRFEAELLNMCKTPAFAAVYDCGTLRDGEVDRPYMVMEYLGGASVAAYLEQKRVFPPALAARVAVSLCEALQELHRYKVVYRDLSPGNVILEEGGAYGLTPRLFDLSHAMITGIDGMDSRGEAGEVLAGTPPFAAPELAAGAGDHRADIYSVAALFYTMVTGEPPLRLRSATWGDYAQAVSRVKTLPEVPLRKLRKGLPKRLDTLLASAMSPDPAARPESMGAFQDDLVVTLLDSSLLDEGREGLSLAAGLLKMILRK